MRTNIKTIIGIAFASVLVLTVSCKGKTEEAKEETSTEATMEHEGHDMEKEGHDMEKEGHDMEKEGHDMEKEGHDMEKEGHDMESMETADMQGKEYTSTYVCPMHCEGSGSDEEGKCPVCGMAYVLNEDHMADGHTHN